MAAEASMAGSRVGNGEVVDDDKDTCAFAGSDMPTIGVTNTAKKKRHFLSSEHEALFSLLYLQNNQTTPLATANPVGCEAQR